MTKNEWLRFAVALASALGAVHLAVGIALIGSGKVPVGLALAAGVAAFIFVVQVNAPTPQHTAGLRYGVPVFLAVMVKLLWANPSDLDSAQGEALRFLVTVWTETPAPCYLMAAVYALAKAERPRIRNPFEPPGN